MALTWSIREAGARFSGLIGQVRAGRVVTVSCRGEPVAEIRPVEPAERPLTPEERLSELERSGSLVRSSVPRQTLRPVARRPGALARLLAGRGE